jgi:hypothetical protein
MKSSTPSNVAASPLGVPLDLLTEQGTGSATVEILHSVTSDLPDGRPWPPPENDVLWAVVRRADGCTHWRAIELAQSDRCHGLCNSAEAATAMRGSHYDEG